MTTTSTAPRTYTATLPNGEQATRITRSARLNYSHVRVINLPTGTIVSWHTSADLAANGRVDVAAWRNYRWDVVEAHLAGEQVAPAAAPAAGPIGRDQLAAGDKLATIGHGKAIHLVHGWDGERNTDCPASSRDNRAYGTVYDRDAVVTCKACTKAHRA